VTVEDVKDAKGRDDVVIADDVAGAG